MKQKLFALLLAGLMTVSLAACGQTPTNTASSGSASADDVQTVETLKIAFSPYQDADSIMTATEPMKTLLHDQLLEEGYDVQDIELTVGTSYSAVGEALSSGSVDAGFISGGTYCLYDEDCDVLLTALRSGTNKDSTNPAEWNDGTIEEESGELANSYRSILLAGPSEKGQELLAKVNNGEELTWEDLNGATWSVMSPASASGYIYPCLWLNQNFGKSISDLDHVVQAESYTTSLSRLASQQVDLLVAYAHIRIKNAPIWESELGGTAPMVEQTGVIGVTDKIFNDTVSVSKQSAVMDDAFRTAFANAMIEMGKTEEGKQVLGTFSMKGLTLANDSDYDSERAAQEMLKNME